MSTAAISEQFDFGVKSLKMRKSEYFFMILNIIFLYEYACKIILILLHMPQYWYTYLIDIFFLIIYHLIHLIIWYFS